MGGGEPGVEGEHGYFNGKGESHGQKRPELEGKGEVLLHELGDIKGAARNTKGDNGDEEEG